MAQSQPADGSPLDILDGIGADVMGGGGARQITATYCKIPMKPLVQKTQQGSQKQATGIAIEGAMQRFNNMTAQCLLQLKVTNHTSEPLMDFVFKMNVNHFGFTVDEGVPQGFVVGPGCTAETSVLCTPTAANA
jgi:hypothetical protein